MNALLESVAQDKIIGEAGREPGIKRPLGASLHLA